MKKFFLILATILLASTKCFAQCNQSIDGKLICNFGIVDYEAIYPAPAVSNAGSARVYFDLNDMDLKCSENGEAYVDCVGGGGGGGTWGSIIGTLSNQTDLQNALNAASAFSGWTDGGTNVYVTTSTDNVGIGTSQPASKLQVSGAVTIDTTTTTSYLTPVGSLIPTKINIPNFDPGAFGQIIAFGLAAGYTDTARDITLLDARTTDHQPSIVLISPNETEGIGLSWDGSNTSARLESTKAIGFRTNSILTGADTMTITTGGNVGIGSVNPSQALNVTGNILASGTIAGSNLSGTNTGDNTVATTGDSATAFFSTGTIEHERGGLEADVSAYDGLIGITGGAAYNQTGTTTQIIIFDGSGAPTSAALSGDVTMTNAGVVTIGTNTVALTTDTTGNYAAGDAEAGNALTGDTATAFFSAGTIEVVRGGTGAAPGADDQVFISDSTSAGTWRAIGDCDDSGGNHINYDTGTNTWSCGTSSSGAGGWTDGGTNVYVSAIGDNVGIGTTALSTGKLTVAGNGSTTGINSQWQTNAGAAKITFLDNGNVGIGSTNPARVLDIVGAGNFSSTLGASNLSGTNTGDQTITLTGDVTGAGTGSFAATIASATSATWAGKVSDETGTGVWAFATAPTFTTSITDPLVIGGTAVSSTLKLQSTSGNGTSDAIIACVGNNCGTEAMRITTVGNVGIGTTQPLSVLEVNGVEAAGLGSVGAPSHTFRGDLDTGLWESAANNMNFSTGGSERMRIDSAGNVGIGTTGPTQTFEVNGTMRTYGNTSNSYLNSTGGNVGIGSTFPGALLDVAGKLRLTGGGNIVFSGTAPTVANNDCGTTTQGTVTAKSTNNAGSVTVGTLNVTSCSVTFNTAVAYLNAPFCVCIDDTSVLGIRCTTTTTKLTIASTTSMSVGPDVISWICGGGE